MLLELEDLCRRYDTYYEMSDDYSVWRRGNSADGMIRQIVKTLGKTSEVKAILEKYRGKMISAPGSNLCDKL